MKLPRLRTVLLTPVVLFALLYIAIVIMLAFDDRTEPPNHEPPARYETIAIFGATGTAGDGILKAALTNPEIENIHVVTRRVSPRIEAGIASGKVQVTLHKDYLDYSAIREEIAMIDAVYWAIGTNSIGVDEKTYGMIHVDFPLQFVTAWAEVSNKPDISFHYISSSDISADSSMMWAREKVRAEKTLFEFAEGSNLRVIAYRPDYIGPTKEEAHLGQNLLYWFFAPVRAAVRATQIGQAMFEVTARGSQFENGTKIGTGRTIRLSDAYERRQVFRERLTEYELTGSTMGTSFSVKLVNPPEDLAKEALGAEIHNTLEKVDQLASTYRASSELSVFNANRTTEWVAVSPELCNVVEQAQEISRRTDGAFDITVGPLVNLWGFGPDGLVTEPPSQAAIEAAMTGVGFQQLETRCAIPEMRKTTNILFLDLSGWAKGYAVDRLADLLDERSISNYMAEVGGELRMRGLNAAGLKWAIGIEKPLDGKRLAQSMLRLTNTGVATSGDYRNFFDHEDIRYSHTIDTRTGRPVEHALAAVTVIAPAAAFADAMATALLVLGPEEGLKLAEETGLAVYFQVRGDEGIDEVCSSALDQVFQVETSTVHPSPSKTACPGGALLQ